MIYPDSFAEMLKERAGEKYRPSNGTEGELFMEAWCRNCARDKAMNEGKDFDECDDNELCQIIADTFHYRVDDSRYPKEWKYGKDGQPCCTAFVPTDQPVPAPRCQKTTDMFSQEAA